MPLEEVDKYLDKIRNWLMKYPDEHPLYPKVRFALSVAYCARHLKRDPFVDLIIDTIT
jgi:phosphate uptake regulator